METLSLLSTPISELNPKQPTPLSPTTAVSHHRRNLSPAIATAATPATKKSPTGRLAAKPAAKLPSKPLPPTQAVQEAKTDAQRGGGRFGGRGGGRGGRGGGRGFNRDSADNKNSYGTNNGFNGGYKPSEDGDIEKSTERRGFNGPRSGYRGGHRGSYSNGDAADGERPRRVFERCSRTGRGNEFKREGAGRGNWGTATDEFATLSLSSIQRPALLL